MKTPRRYVPPQERTSLLLTLVLVVLAVFFFYPFAWMLMASFKTNPQIFRPFQVWSGPILTEFYGRLFRGEWFPLVHVLFNSIWVALLQSAGAVALASLAGYVFGRHRLAGGRWLFLLAVVVIVLPQQALALSLFTWVDRLGLMDRLAGVILPGMVSGLGVLYFTQIFRQVPDELIEAARLEGASEFRVYCTLLPLVRPALLSFLLIQFILSWHEHLIPLLVLNSPERQTLPLALAGLYGSSLRFPYAVLMAASTLSVLPTALLFGLFYRRCKSSLAEVMTS